MENDYTVAYVPTELVIQLDELRMGLHPGVLSEFRPENMGAGQECLTLFLGGDGKRGDERMQALVLQKVEEVHTYRRVGMMITNEFD